MRRRKAPSAFDAAMEAARLRLRPILMTSIAFIAGVMPLALAHGAGAGSQNAIGTGVVGGMITATVLAIFFVPVFFQLVNTQAAAPQVAAFGQCRLGWAILLKIREGSMNRLGWRCRCCWRLAGRCLPRRRRNPRPAITPSR